MNQGMILGNAYEEIKRIPDKSIDLIITDPPYDIDTKHHKNGQISKSLAKLITELDESGVIGGINIEILNDFIRVLKTINIYIWCNRKQILSYLDFFVKKHGCKYDVLAWIKSNPIPTCGNRYLNDKEYCLYFRKNTKLHTTYKRGHTYWITSINKKDKALYNHPTVKPQIIIEDMILNSSDEGDMVLDPFAGTGTMGVAAKRFNRYFVGIEIKQKFYETANNRINEVIPVC